MLKWLIKLAVCEYVRINLKVCMMYNFLSFKNLTINREVFNIIKLIFVKKYTPWYLKVQNKILKVSIDKTF